ncbi:MAG: DUF721 domain-containing protein [Nitrososphaerales archaeon]
MAGLSPPTSRTKGPAAEPNSPTRPSVGRMHSAGSFGSVFSRWEELVGPAVARHATPVRLEGGTLVVAVDQPPWATQVRVLAPGIVARISEQTGHLLDRLEVVVVRPSR